MRYYNDYLQTDDTLAHYGVLGMKRGVRHDKERANSKRNQMRRELDELRRYEANARKNPKSLGASKLSTAVRNHQIRSLEKKISKTSKNSGVRKYQNADGTLTNGGKRKKAKRNRKIKRLESSVSSLSAENKLRKAELDDLNARGVKSPIYREAYIKALDTAYRHDPTSKHINLNRDRILNSEKQYRSSTINANNRIIDKNKKLIDNVKNTPLNDKTAFDKSRPYHVASIGALGISTALGAYGGTKLGNVYAGAAVGFMGGAAGVLLSGMGDKSRPEYWVKDKK